MTRARRKQKGLANVVYVRFGQTFILMATPGEHAAFDKIVSRDFRECPLHFSGYSIGIKNKKPHVIIEPKRFKGIHTKAHKIALHNSGKVTRKLVPHSFEKRYIVIHSINALFCPEFWESF